MVQPSAFIPEFGGSKPGASGTGGRKTRLFVQKMLLNISELEFKKIDNKLLAIIILCKGALLSKR
jgi:hypothetical protein